MPPTDFATLSQKLLDDAKRFQGYPRRIYRTRKNLKFQEEVWDPIWKGLVDWRKTCEPKGAEVAGRIWPPGLVDEMYCREMLEEIPEMVERTGRLSRISLAGLPPDSFRQLREAAECYIRGFPLASVALSRAAIEVPIRAAVAKTLGASAVEGQDFFAVLKNLVPRTRVLPEADLKLAHRVRTAANDVLHKGAAAALEEALEILEAARTVVMALTKRPA